MDTTGHLKFRLSLLQHFCKVCVSLGLTTRISTHPRHSQIYPSNYTSSPCHRFIKLIEDKGKVRSSPGFFGILNSMLSSQLLRVSQLNPRFFYFHSHFAVVHTLDSIKLTLCRIIHKISIRLKPPLAYSAFSNVMARLPRRHVFNVDGVFPERRSSWIYSSKRCRCVQRAMLLLHRRRGSGGVARRPRVIGTAMTRMRVTGRIILLES